MLKRSIVIFLLPLYALTSLGTLTPYWTLLHRSSFRLRLRQGEFEDLTVFHLSAEEYNSLNWTEKGREFMKDEKMFDISSVEKTDTGYTVVCKHDEAESLVVKLLSSHKTKRKQTDPTKKRTDNNLSSKHFPTSPSQMRVDFFALCSLKRLEKPSKLQIIYSDIESPPPEYFRLAA